VDRNVRGRDDGPGILRDHRVTAAKTGSLDGIPALEVAMIGWLTLANTVVLTASRTPTA